MLSPRVLSVAAALGVVMIAFLLALHHINRPQPCTDRSSTAYTTPIAAALSSVWRQPGMSRPARLALNVPPSLDLDLSALHTDVAGWHSALTLFRDTSWFAGGLISIDSLRVLHVVYDVRRLARSEWTTYWTTVWSVPGPKRGGSRDSLIVRGDVYRVGYESCRGWPCHGDTYVEVRQTRHGYVGCRVLLVGVE